MTEPRTSPRERYRSQVRAEIKERAWEQIATAGASALSLNAIAKQMGMSGPALYRYFAGRDDLITELIRDAYRSLADTVRATATATATDSPDLTAVGHAIRRWALDDPHRYLLIYGTPIPGYHAPDDITDIANEIMTVLLAACGPLTEAEGGRAEPPPAMRLALSFWTRVHGVLSLELAGHFSGMKFDPARLFEAELGSLARP
ncbi:TetR/AcrR family transcriptional regulator [Spongiactinospora rosea]|uniref:TetR/AcrR family transcriptional regulator n=1 Tax=Spongiactinospora rosea TaxID=2248750 RepID=A0A366LV86_9ACTN|nr:TetR/AcrR family transcriptional regulator [Spongiactinospora rosea]RBQ17463.1 TetR/AcrR family transcriptional regulator [Spongiactinospora rosea]